MAAVIAALAGVAILIQFGFRRIRLPLRRLESRAGAPQDQALNQPRPRGSLLLRLSGWAGKRLSRLPVGDHGELLAAAGMDWSETQFRGLRLICALALTLLPLRYGPLALLLLGPATVAIGLQVPVIGLKRRASRRAHRIALELPECMDHLALLLAAGQGLGAALDRCANLGDGPLYDELGLALRQVHLGRDRTGALEEMCDRNPAPELRRVCRSLTRAERFGGPIAASIAEIAADLRAARFQAARAQAARAPVKLLFPLVFMILPSFILLTVGGFVLSILSRW